MKPLLTLSMFLDLMFPVSVPAMACDDCNTGVDVTSEPPTSTTIHLNTGQPGADGGGVEGTISIVPRVDIECDLALDLGDDLDALLHC